MGFHSFRPTLKQAAIRIVALEAMMVEKDTYRLDELFTVYKTAKPSAIVMILFDSHFPQHLTELFALLLGYGKLCANCYNVYKCSGTAHYCRADVKKSKECLFGCVNLDDSKKMR